MLNERRQGIIEMSAAMLISGSIGYFVVISGMPVVNVVFWRCAIGALALLAICAGLGLLRRQAMTARQVFVAVLGGLAIVANWLLLFAAYPHASISVATTVYNTQPFMLLVLGALFLGERITGAKVVWLALAFLGVVLIVQAKQEQSGLSGHYALGVLLALAAALFYALAAFAAKWLKGTPPHLVALIQVITGVLLLAPITDFSALPQGAGGWSVIAIIGVVHTGIMYILLYGAIQKLPVHLTGALSFIYPIASIAVDRLAFGHHLQPIQIAGSLLVLIAAAGNTLGWSWCRLIWQRA
jgi:drug/metabolite transporter (DMT)-like permease